MRTVQNLRSFVMLMSPLMAWVGGLDGLSSCEAQNFSESITITQINRPAVFFHHNGASQQLWELWGSQVGFGVSDITGDKTPFVIWYDAAQNAFMLRGNRAGFGIWDPQQHLHVSTTDMFPTLRLETNNPASQVWDVSGSIGGFDVVDVTNAEAVPLRIESGTPAQTLYLSNRGSGHVGVGTNSPDLIGTVSTGGNARHINLDAGTGQARHIIQGQLGAELFMVHKGAAANRKIVRFGVSGGKYRIACLTDNLQGNTESSAFCIDMATTNVGIKTPNPTRPLQVGDTGANDGNGAHVTTGGVWTNASSRSVKQDIRPISVDEARETIRALQPVEYRYKNELDEQYVGFIAEDVPDLVATRDRKSLASMDVTAVLTRIVQDQDQKLAEERDKNARQEKLLVEQKAVIADLTQRLQTLERRVGE